MESNDKKRMTDLLPDWHPEPEGAALLGTGSSVDVTNLPLPRAIFKLAVPATGSMLLIMLFGLVDAWFVGRLGAEAFAGVSAGGFVIWAVQSISLVISEGLVAVASRAIGAKDSDTAELAFAQSLILAGLVSFVTSALCLAAEKPMLAFMGLEGKAAEAASSYLSTMFFGLFFLFESYTLDAAFRSMGDTTTPLIIIAGSLVLNGLLDYLLIFGIGPFPRLEAQGAALATVLAHVVALVLSLIFLQRKAIHLRIKNLQRLNWTLMRRVAVVGAPIALSSLLFSLSYMTLTRLISGYGAHALAAIGVGHRIEGICYYVAVGFSMAAATLVGQHLGAGKPENASKAVKLGLFYVSIFMLAVSIVFFLYGGRLIRFFIDDPAVIREGALYLRIVAVFELFLGFEIVYEGAFSGAGDTIPPMLISVPLTWARIPLAFLLSDTFGLGSVGIWWAISITTGLKGAIMALWFARGRWKHKKV
ncbi:MAG: MATE family efflux transporter [candidate division KSB1 bacterium]|nr:MATE family efflux transporter [candidate division KSB1 bacterium]